MSEEQIGIVLPGFVRDFKNVPEERSYCTGCGKKVTDDTGSVISGVVWYSNGFSHKNGVCDK